jgi:hypothetical protein
MTGVKSSCNGNSASAGNGVMLPAWLRHNRQYAEVWAQQQHWARLP